MNPFLQSLTMTYLLYPILGLLLVGLGIFIAKKNALLGNKRLVGYTIGAILALSAPAMLGFLNYNFMPYCYMALIALYLVLGWYTPVSCVGYSGINVNTVTKSYLPVSC